MAIYRVTRAAMGRGALTQEEAAHVSSMAKAGCRSWQVTCSM